LLAAVLDSPQTSFASKSVMEDGKVSAIREGNGELEIISLTLPAVLTTDLRLTEHHCLTLPS
jgi:electron transfer flavoprotein beta subunit